MSRSKATKYPKVYKKRSESKSSVMCNKRSTLFAVQWCILIVVGIKPSQLELVGVSYSPISPNVAICMPVWQAVGARCFSIRLGSFTPCVYGIEVEKHVDDCSDISKNHNGVAGKLTEEH
jgi:hypothetical protein